MRTTTPLKKSRQLWSAGPVRSDPQQRGFSAQAHTRDSPPWAHPRAAPVPSTHMQSRSAKPSRELLAQIAVGEVDAAHVSEAPRRPSVADQAARS
jgi:hypothetical protein